MSDHTCAHTHKFTPKYTLSLLGARSGMIFNLCDFLLLKRCLREFPGSLEVKDWVLSLLWLRSLLWYQFLARNFCRSQVWPKQTNKQTNNNKDCLWWDYFLKKIFYLPWKWCFMLFFIHRLWHPLQSNFPCPQHLCNLVLSRDLAYRQGPWQLWLTCLCSAFFRVTGQKGTRVIAWISSSTWDHDARVWTASIYLSIHHLPIFFWLINKLFYFKIKYYIIKYCVF